MNENQCQSYSTLYPRHYHRFNQWKSTWSLYLNDARLIKIPIFFTKLTARAAHTQTHTSWLKWLCLWNWYKNLFFSGLWTPHTHLTSLYYLLPIGTNGESLDFLTSLFTCPSVSYSWNCFRSDIFLAFGFWFTH